MEKVRITREQAEALEEMKRYLKPEEILSANVRCRVFNEMRNEAHKRLAHLTLTALTKALYIGYETKPDFNLGDWAVDKITGKVGRVTHISTNHIDIEGVECKVNKDQARHATESETEEGKQRVWWTNHGRDVWELKPKDVLVAEDGGYLVEVKRVLSCGSPLFYGGVKSIPLDEVEEMFKVVCFAKDRKDV